MAGEYYFWLGASANAETGSRADASSPQAVSTKGFDPARWHFRQYGYEKFSIFDARGSEIGFVHRRRDAERIASEWRA